MLPRAGGSITDVRITPEGTSAADANAHMLHIYVAQRTIDCSTTIEDFSTNLIMGKSPQNGTERVSVTSAKTFFSIEAFPKNGA